MDAVEQPPAVGLPLGPHDLDGLRHPGIRVRAGAAEVVERAQHVVAPVVREREVEIRRIDDLARALAAEQAALEQVLLPAAAGLAHRGGTAGRALELEQPVEHVDRRVERGAHRPVLGLAVPAAVGEPLAEDPLDDRGDVHPEVGAGLDRPAVDARLDLAVEVPLPGVLPAPVLGDERDRAAGRLATPGRARGSAGSAGCASSPSRAARVRRRCSPPGSRRRRPTTRRRPRAPGGGRPSPRAPRALARRRPRRARHPSDRAAPASGWRGRPRAANRSRPSPQASPGRRQPLGAATHSPKCLQLGHWPDPGDALTSPLTPRPASPAPQRVFFLRGSTGHCRRRCKRDCPSGRVRQACSGHVQWRWTE